MIVAGTLMAPVSVLVRLMIPAFDLALVPSRLVGTTMPRSGVAVCAVCAVSSREVT